MSRSSLLGDTSSESRLGVFCSSLGSVCEPQIGDIGCIDDEDDHEEQLPEHFVRLLKIEDCDLTIRPNELVQMVIDLSVNKKESEMRQAEKEYQRLKYSKNQQRDGPSEVGVEANYDFGVVPSGRAVITKGDIDDHIQPETF